MIKYFIIGFIASAVLTHYGLKYKLAQAKQYKNFKTPKDCLAVFRVNVPDGYVIFHKNGNKSDNTFNNLELITRTELMKRIGKKKNVCERTNA